MGCVFHLWKCFADIQGVRTRSSPSMSWSKHLQSVWPLLSRVYSDRLKADLSLSLTSPALMSLVNLTHCMLPAIASFCRSLPRGTLLLNLSSRYARWFRLGFPGVSVQIPQPDLNQISYNWGKTWPIPLFLLHWV